MGTAEDTVSSLSQNIQSNSNQHAATDSLTPAQNGTDNVEVYSNAKDITKESRKQFININIVEKLEELKYLKDNNDALKKQYKALIPQIKVYETQLTHVLKVKIKASLFALAFFFLLVYLIILIFQYLIFQNNLSNIDIFSRLGIPFDITFSIHALLQKIIIGVIVIVEFFIVAWPYFNIFVPLFRLPSNFWQNMYIHYGWAIIILLANISAIYFTRNSSFLFAKDLELALVLWTLVGVGIFILLLILLIVFNVFLFEFERWSNTAYPVACLVNNLVLVLNYTQENESKLFFKLDEVPKLQYKPIKFIFLKYIPLLEDERMKAKKWLLSQIEATASCFYYLALNFQTGDFATNSYMRQTAGRAAAALRDKKKWILTPNEFTTYNDFPERIKEILENVVNGNWDAIELMEKDDYEKLPSPPKRSWLDRIPTPLRLLLIAALPVVGFLILQWTSWWQPLDSTTTRSYVIIGLFIWILLTILTELDQKLKDKTDIIRGILPYKGGQG